jgi:hypothetical protein
MEKWLLSLDDTFERWMYPFDSLHYSGYLKRPGQIIVEKLRASVSGKQQALIGRYCLELENYARETQNSQEIAEALVQCARVKSVFGEPGAAETMLREARMRYEPDQHCRAVTNMMMGSLLWRIEQRREEAITCWAECERIFSELSDFSLIDEARAKWYQQQIPKINALLDWASQVLSRRGTRWKDHARRRYIQRQSLSGFPAIKRSRPAAARPTAGTSASQGPAAPTGKQAPLTWTELFGEDYLSICEVSTAVPAGGFRSTDGDPYPVGEVHIPLATINNEQYRVINLRRHGGHEVNLIHVKYPTVVRVAGNSMNAVPILDGEYVLINPEQKPQNGDIVLASSTNSLTGEAEQTLKFYREEPDRIVLRSQSTDPKIPREWFSVSKADLASGKAQLDIRGVVLARFASLSEKPGSGGS